MSGSAAIALGSVPWLQSMVQSVAALSHMKPSSPRPIRWLPSTERTNVDISLAHPVIVSVLQSGLCLSVPDAPHRGSFASSQAMIVGSSLYLTPVTVFTRLSRWVAQSLYHLSLIHISEPT